MSEGVERLARAYIERQGLDRDRAVTLAREVDEDPDVMSAALAWADTGRFGEQPEREGYSPAKLKDFMRPSGVFSTLVGLGAEPHETLMFLRRDRASFIHRHK
jgi:hypothetical protein